MKTDYQQVALFRNGDGTTLCLDGFARFSEVTQRDHAAIMVSVPLASASRTEAVMIVGGGDGLLARNALWFPVRVVMVLDRDPAVVALAKNPPLSNLNQGSMADRRVRATIGDEARMVDRMKKGIFDLVAVDIPPTESRSELFGADFFGRCVLRLSPGGVMAVRASEGIKYAEWVLGYMEKVLGNGVLVNATFWNGKTERYVYGSRCPIRIQRVADARCGETILGFHALLASGARTVNYKGGD
jgi:predicted membrane-bound spermidine synthase